jgi:GntR family transcriptional regulator/MocR family aminotransferase
LGIHLQLESEEPLYQQLFDQIATRVRTQAWPTGYRLPPTRALADELGVHRNTVVRAFEELCAAGFLTSTVGRGTFVAAPAAAVGQRRLAQTELPWDSLLSGAALAEPLSRLDRFRRDGVPRGAINLSSLQPPPELLPDVALRRCVDHVLRTLGPRALGYAPSDGVLSLREQIARDLSHAGVPAQPDDILVTTGSQQALDLVARALVNPGDRFLVDGVTYTGALNLLHVAGASVVGVPADAEGPDLDRLRRLSRGEVKGLYLMPNCHNPTGAVISAKRRQELVEWSHEVQAPLIEDDYGADLDLDGESVPPYLRALDSQVIYMSTFSKKLIPGLRVGFIAAPPRLRERLTALKHALDLGTSALLQHALAEFLERGYHRAHFKRTLPEYRRRRDTLQAALERHLPGGVRWQRPKRGLTLWLELPELLDPEDVYLSALRQGVVVSPGTLHAAQGRPHAGVRLSFCSEPEERLAQGAKRLGRALEELLSHQRERRHGAPAMHGV